MASELSGMSACAGNNTCCNRPYHDRVMFPCSESACLKDKVAELERRISSRPEVPAEVMEAANRYRRFREIEKVNPRNGFSWPAFAEVYPTTLMYLPGNDERILAEAFLSLSPATPEVK